MSFLKTISGKVATDAQLMNMRTGNIERIGKTVMMRGKKQEEMSCIAAGDIGAVPKLGTSPQAIRCVPRRARSHWMELPIRFRRFPWRLCPRKRARKIKVAQGLFRLIEEAPPGY